MARWNEDQERWQGHGDRYGDDERRFRAERGEEGSWRGRELSADEDRFQEWRGERSGERGGDWRERERWMRGREPGAEWEREPARADFGREVREPGGRYGERGSESWRDREWRALERGSYGRPYGGGTRPYGGGERWAGRSGSYGRGTGEWGGDYVTYGSQGYGPERGYGYDREREGWGRRDMGPGGWRYGEERERSPFERVKEGFRKLTGQGPKGYRRSDERVRDEVCERIARSGINAMEVEVAVEKGEVTLSGYAQSREDKRMLEDVAEDVFGVDEVHNHVRIRREQGAGTTMAASSAPTTGTTATSAQQGTARAPSPQQQPGRH